MKLIFLKRYCLLLMVVMVAAMLSDGYMGGDEGAIYTYTNLYFDENNPSLLKFLFASRVHNEYLQHHLFWFFIQVLVGYIISAFLNLSVIIVADEFRNWMFAFPFAMLALFSTVVSYRVLRRLGKSPPLAQLCVGVFFFGGSAIGLLTGGLIECYILWAVSIRMLLLTPAPNRKVQGHLLTLLDFTLIAAKPYALIFLIATLPGTWSKLREKDRWHYLLGIFLLCTLFFIIKSLVPVAEYDEFWTLWNRNIAADISFELLLKHLGLATFSFSFGLVWTTPLILLFGMPRNMVRSELLQKLFGIFALELVFCLYPFWHGASGMPGQRYVLPFLVALLPEMCIGLQELIRRTRMTLVGLLVVIALFLPAIDFRNSLADLYASKSSAGIPYVEFGYSNFPMFDLSFHPGVFAWRVVIDKMTQKELIPASTSVGPILEIASIFPMTGVSRFIFAVRTPQDMLDPRLTFVRNLTPDWFVYTIVLLRALLISLLLFTLFSAVYRIIKGVRRSS